MLDVDFAVFLLLHLIKYLILADICSCEEKFLLTRL